MADICYLQPEGAPREFVPPPRNGPPHTRPGYNFDGCTAEVVLTRMTVRNGRLVLPDGMSYRVLVLPDVETMTPALLRKVKELIEAGATVVGGRAPRKSPSLTDYPACDAEVQQLTELWQGKIVTDKTAEQLLAARGVKPDFAATAWLRYIHRVVGDVDVYFVSNPEPRTVEAVATFRVDGKQPELWRPDTGRIEPVAAFRQEAGCTRVPLRLDPSGSVFVVFRRPVGQFDPIVTATRDGQSILPRSTDAGAISPTVAEVHADTAGTLVLETWQPGRYDLKTAGGKTLHAKAAGIPPPIGLTGPWEVTFPAGNGAPPQATFNKLLSWSEHADRGIKYFSGTATYRKTFNLPDEQPGKDHRVYLDLGEVAVMAEVNLNGRDLGILWKRPYRADATDAIRSGKNVLEVKVVNLWANRLIGDEQLPDDSPRADGQTLKQWPQWLLEGKSSPTGRYTFTSHRLWKKDDPLLPSGLLGPVTLQTTQCVPVK
ncbi:MAG: glycosylhydrolase-like jelly roll fold domain-containing protein [Actinomycetes bacterium]